AGEKTDGLLDQLGIVAVRDDAGTRRRAALDLVEEAGPRPALVEGIRTGADEEGALHGIDGARYRSGRCERTEIPALTRAGGGMLGHCRRGVIGGDQDVWKRLVVAEEDIEAGPEALDQIGLEKQGLGLGSGGDELHRRGRLDGAGDAAGLVGEPGIALDAL